MRESPEMQQMALMVIYQKMAARMKEYPINVFE